MVARIGTKFFPGYHRHDLISAGARLKGTGKENAMIFRKMLLGLAVALFASDISSVQTPGAKVPVTAKTTPQQSLTLTPVQGTANVFTDTVGNRFTVQPEDGGSLCDPNGCMVKVCTASGACSWYYCTAIKCVSIRPQGAPVPGDKSPSTG
ncbi:hypothetical protein ACXU4B_10180 [Dyella soli]|uniref:Uncharacterized protein n=1 Tax=Dyella soli TaxID=522319 RepID=A0A4R0YWC0_9GAMM|nr:hypothetical protein [Dyella soli]TCI11293.1 hypothetical protein EZM97_21070 [Dyella soli]